MSTSRIMKFITGGCEAFLAIPLLGGSLIMATYYIPLIVMLALHIVTLILTNKDRGFSIGSVLGIVTSIIGWIPIVGWFMHLLSAIFLIIGGITKDRNEQVIVEIERS